MEIMPRDLNQHFKNPEFRMRNFTIPHFTVENYIFVYSTVQAQVYTRARVKRRALAWRGVRVFQVLDKAFTREAHTCCNLSPFACIAASL